MRSFPVAIGALLFSSISALADVSYTQTMKYTGGSMLDVIRGLANNPALANYDGSLKSVTQDQTFKIYIKGQKMARVGQNETTIFDLDSATMTRINHEKRSYRVSTFAELEEQMESARQRMGGQGGDVQFDTKVEKRAGTRLIEGKSSSEVLITMTAKPDGPMGKMAVRMTAWVAPLDDSTREVADYMKRLSKKFSYAFSGFALALGPAGAGLNAAIKESLVLDGFPLLTETEVSGTASPTISGTGSNREAPFIQIESESKKFAAAPVAESVFAVPPDYRPELAGR